MRPCPDLIQLQCDTGPDKPRSKILGVLAMLVIRWRRRGSILVMDRATSPRKVLPKYMKSSEQTDMWKWSSSLEDLMQFVWSEKIKIRIFWHWFQERFWLLKPNEIILGDNMTWSSGWDRTVGWFMWAEDNKRPKFSKFMNQTDSLKMITGDELEITIWIIQIYQGLYIAEWLVDQIET